MRPFIRALADARRGLWVPWRALNERGIRAVPGTLVILLGAPGSLKSTLALAWAHHLMERGEPVLLVSLDTDSRTQAARLVSLMTGLPWQEVAEDPVWADWLAAQHVPLRVVDTPVSAEDIDEVLVACAEYWGRAPSLVIVDDLSKLRMDRSYEAFDAATLELHRAARRHDTVVLVLHHLHRGESSNRDRPIRLADGKYTGEYEAEIVLGAWRPRVKVLRVSVLKNRFGEDNPSGALYAELYADPARCEIRDIEYWDRVLDASES